MKFIAKIIIIIVIFVAGIYVGQTNKITLPIKVTQPQESGQQQDNQETKVNLMFDFGNGQVQVFNDILAESDDTVFDLLKKVTEENKIEFKYKDYGELGVFVEAINGFINNGQADRFWQYWVNNNYAQIGASLYELQNNDVVEWKYIKGQIK